MRKASCRTRRERFGGSIQEFSTGTFIRGEKSIESS